MIPCIACRKHWAWICLNRIRKRLGLPFRQCLKNKFGRLHRMLIYWGGGVRYKLKAWRIIAVAAILACAVLLFLLLFPRKGAPAGDGDIFNAETYRQNTPVEPGRAYLTFDNKVWDEVGEHETWQHYCFTMREQNGTGFNISRVELQLESKNGGTRSAVYAAADLRAASLNPDIPPYGEMPFEGGFPKGEFLRAGIAVYGTDTNETPMTFYSLIEF